METKQSLAAKLKLCKDCVDEGAEPPYERLPNTSYCYEHRKKRNRERSRKQRLESAEAMERMVLEQKERNEMLLQKLQEEERYGPPPENFGIGAMTRQQIDEAEEKLRQLKLKDFAPGPEGLM